MSRATVSMRALSGVPAFRNREFADGLSREQFRTKIRAIFSLSQTHVFREIGLTSSVPVEGGRGEIISPEEPERNQVEPQSVVGREHVVEPANRKQRIEAMDKKIEELEQFLRELRGQGTPISS